MGDRARDGHHLRRQRIPSGESRRRHKRRSQSRPDVARQLTDREGGALPGGGAGRALNDGLMTGPAFALARVTIRGPIVAGFAWRPRGRQICETRHVRRGPVAVPSIGSVRDKQADVTRPGEFEGGAVRASDDERNRITDQLRFHCAAGRITVEELEHRLGQAMSAQSVGELASLVHDLPRNALAVEQPRRPPPRVGLPGVRPFTYRLAVPSPLERTRVAALDTIATGLNRSRWELMRQTPTSLEFKRSGNERIVMDLEPKGTAATTMIVHGRAPRRVRSQFAKLTFQ